MTERQGRSTGKRILNKSLEDVKELAGQTFKAVVLQLVEQQMQTS